MASNEDGFMSDDSAFAAENGYVPESSDASDDGYEPESDGATDGYVAESAHASELSIEELLDGAGDVRGFGYLDPDLGPPGSSVGADSEFSFLDLGMGPVSDDVGVEHLTLAADGTYGFTSKVSAAGQAAIKREGDALAAANGGHRKSLMDALNALLASGGISVADASAAAAEHGLSSGGFNLGNVVSDIGNAAGSLATGAEKAAGAVVKGVGEEVSTAFTTAEKEAADVGSTIGKVAGDVVHGNFKGAVSDVTAGAKAAAAIAATGVKDELAHAKATAQSVAQDVINGVAGAEKSLIAMVSQFSPEDLVEMVEKDFEKLRAVFEIRAMA